MANCVYPNCRNRNGASTGVCRHHREKLATREYSPVDESFLGEIEREEPLEHADFVDMAIDEAKCKDILCPDELFFPDHTGNVYTPSQRFCHDCPMRIQCAIFALANKEPFGVWGGLSRIDRKAVAKMLKERREVAA